MIIPIFFYVPVASSSGGHWPGEAASRRMREYEERRDRVRAQVIKDLGPRPIRPGAKVVGEGYFRFGIWLDTSDHELENEITRRMEAQTVVEGVRR
mgnify:CR=1 FL=1